MKNIIKRNLPLNVKYTVLEQKYIPLFDGGGCTCDNCGKLIANIATVKSKNGVFNIGFDCMETFLLNNSLLDGFDLERYEKIKKAIPKITRFSKQLKETISKNRHLNITGLLFEESDFDWFPFYYLKNNETKSRDNDCVKLKEVPFEFFIETIKNIFPELQILTKNQIKP